MMEMQREMQQMKEQMLQMQIQKPDPQVDLEEKQNNYPREIKLESQRLREQMKEQMLEIKQDMERAPDAATDTTHANESSRGGRQDALAE